MIISNLCVSYGDKPVINDLSLNIKDNAITMLVAPSGFGKTTLFKAISGLVDKSGDISGYSEVAYSFQEPRLLPWLNAIENVALVKADADRQAIVVLLKRLGLSDDEMRLRAAQLSGGMKQRVNIARAVYYDADLLLLDEPFAGLDEDNIQRVASLLQEIKYNKTILIISHEKSDSTWIDEVIRLEDVHSEKNKKL